MKALLAERNTAVHSSPILRVCVVCVVFFRHDRTGLGGVPLLLSSPSPRGNERETAEAAVSTGGHRYFYSEDPPSKIVLLLMLLLLLPVAAIT